MLLIYYIITLKNNRSEILKYLFSIGLLSWLLVVLLQDSILDYNLLYLYFDESLLANKTSLLIREGCHIIYYLWPIRFLKELLDVTS